MVVTPLRYDERNQKHNKFKRTVIPEDADSLNINTIDMGDASQNIAFVGIYTRMVNIIKVLLSSQIAKLLFIVLVILNYHSNHRSVIGSLISVVLLIQNTGNISIVETWYLILGRGDVQLLTLFQVLCGKKV